MKEIKEISFVRLLSDYAPRLVHTPAILTAVKPDGTRNGMTVSWGGVGILWNMPVTFVFVRPERYTYEFMENGNRMSLSFFAGHADALRIFGTTSGKNTAKEEATGLLATTVGDGIPTYDAAELMIGGRILYGAPLVKEALRDDGVREFYKKEGCHSLYVAAIDGIFAGEREDSGSRDT